MFPRFARPLVAMELSFASGTLKHRDFTQQKPDRGSKKFSKEMPERNRKVGKIKVRSSTVRNGPPY